MTLRSAAGSYEPSSDDVLWLLRAVAREGAPQTLVAQTLVNGFLFARSKGYGKSLGTYVQAYSQPVNPRWLPEGDLHQRELGRATTEAERRALQAKAERRHEYRAALSFGPAVREAVSVALSRSPTFPRATDFAAPTLVRKAPWVALTDPLPGQNRLWARPGATDWSGYTVVGTVGALPLLAAGGVLLLLLLLSRS